MAGTRKSKTQQRIEELEARLQHAEDTLQAIRSGAVDALVIAGPEGERVYTLQTAEHPYRVLVEAINEGAVTLNHDGTILFCNQSFVAFLKTPSEQVLGSAFSRFVAVADRYRFEALIRQCQTKNTKGEITLVAADHGEVPVLLSLCLLPLEDSDGVGIVVTDLSEQKRQQQLVASEKLLRSILEQAAEATVVCDGQGQIIHASRWAHELCGGSPLLRHFDDAFPLVKTSQDETVPVEDPPAPDEKLTFSNILEKKELRGVEATFRSPGGPVLDLLLSAALVLDLEGRILGAVVTLMDITGRKRAEEERKQLLAREREARSESEAANRLKDEFLATVSHELRTPLNAIFGWTRLLRTGTLDSITAARAVEVIDRNAQAQIQLIEDLLDISRIITGKMRFDIHALDVVPVIEAALESVKPAAEARGVKLQSFLDQKTGPVSGDANRIQQIVWNLLSNAIKFTPAGGRVQVKLERIDSQIEITVSDTGKGINPEFLPFVFDRFRQADSSSTRLYSGLGLGLAIVRHLVEAHGGAVQVESEGEGKGTTFIVKLPLAGGARFEDYERRPVEHTDLLDCSPALNGIRVLVVDDEPDTLDLLDHFFMKCGAETKLAATADEGMAAVQSWNPAIIVSDVGMPGKDGYTFIRQVRAWENEHGGWTPAVALTAYARREDRLQALSAGFQTHVSKPVEPNELATVVASLVRQGRGFSRGQ